MPTNLDHDYFKDQPRLHRTISTGKTLESFFRVDGWVDWDGNLRWEVYFLKNIHDRTECMLRRWCTIHMPSPSTMNLKNWGYIWDAQNTRFLRLCEHDVAHPDVDDHAYWASVDQRWKVAHECDGCCPLADEEGVTPVDTPQG